MSRETLLARTLVQLSDTLVDDFDLIELLTLLSTGCVEILDVAAAGLMLASPGGDLRPLASSSDTMRVLEVFEQQWDEGPCPDCYRSGEPVVSTNLSDDIDRWPLFTPRALEAGFRSVYALPMRVRGRTIGALNLFRYGEGELSAADVIVAQALADVATISIIQQRAAADAQALNEQLQHALNSRILIEQAKGILSQALGIDMASAFEQLREHARNSNLKLSVVAAAVVDRSLSPTSLILH
jgi:GAF domain-containing protein